MHVDNLIGRHAELLDDLFAAECLILHAIEHDDAGAHELHQVLVRRNDRYVAAIIDHLAGIGGDQIIGLVALLLDAGDVERFDRIANKRKLRNEFLRRWRAVRLVVLIKIVAKRLSTGIENNGDVGRGFGGLRLAQQLPQHGAEAMHGTNRQTIRWPR